MSAQTLEDVHSMIGITLCYVQFVEKHIKFITTFVLQNGETLDLDKLNSLNKKESKKALGYFLGLIKKRADVIPELGELMTHFLQNRNDFVHNHDKIEGWDLNTEEGVKVAKVFMSQLLLQGQKLNHIFVALTCRWQEQTGIYPKIDHGDEALINKIDAEYGVFVDLMFTQKT
jgi:hypothetical protein